MNVRTDTFIISRQGWDLIAPLGILTLFLLLSIGFELSTFILLLILAFILYIHRNPERIATFGQNGSILSCIDGDVKEIISIEKSPIDGKPGFEIIIESGYLDVSILRAPVNSIMSVEKLRRGATLSLKSSVSELNETADVRFASSIGDVMVRHTLDPWTRPLRFAIEGEIGQNQRYGFMLSGKTSIFLPSNSRVAIKEGMSLKAGESVVGFFSETA